MGLKVKHIRDVAQWQLCCGCGACAYISPDEIEMVDTLEYGRRPLLLDGLARDPRSAEAMQVCPGIELRHTYDRNLPGLVRELESGWGPILEVWEGHAADPEIRFAGSSGGAASALALFCIERLGFHAVLHIAARPEVPYLNHTVLSTTRAEILARTGSRYAPASPCDGLKLIEDAPGQCVFIGKPCDVAAVQKARRLRPALDRKIGLTIAIFCAGTPSLQGTFELLQALAVDRRDVADIRYRGHGWPGMTSVALKAGGERVEMTYRHAWDTILLNHKPFRCHICPDGTGEFADLACGDPWYREIQNSEPGTSLIVVRTELGRRAVNRAKATGFLLAERREPDVLSRSQVALSNRRRHVFPKLIALRLAGSPCPTFNGFHLRRGWLRLPKSRLPVSLYRALRYAWGLRGRRLAGPRYPGIDKGKAGESAAPPSANQVS